MPAKKLTHAQAAEEILATRGLPVSLDSERYVLANIIQGFTTVESALAIVDTQDFHLDSHRHIFACMKELHERSRRVNRSITRLG